MPRRASLGLFLSCCFAANAHAGVIDLGTQIGHANIFTLGDFKAQNSDVEGAVVAGGSVKVSSYSINQNNVDAFGKDGYAVIARNDVKLSNGSIKNGLAYAGGVIKLSSADGPSASTGKPIDFDAASAYYLSLSDDLAALKATGSVTTKDSAALVSGSGSGGIDVFNMSGELFKSASNWKLSGLTAGQTLIFNVGGFDAGARPWGISFEPLKDYNVLFNFYQATTLDPRQIIGSVLAPKAAVSANWGVVKGTVVVGSWDSTIQVDAVNYFKPVELAGFRDPAQVAEPAGGSVPEPGSLGLALAAAGLALYSRRRA